MTDQSDEILDPGSIPHANTAHASPARKALGRLDGLDDFDKIIDMLYEWKRYAKELKFNEMLWTLYASDSSSEEAVLKTLQNEVAQARANRIDRAIAKMGLDEAERILGLER